MAGKSYITKVYNESYKEQVFYAWYRLGRPALSQFIPPPNEEGKIPAKGILSQWKDLEQWDVRADALDARVADQLDNVVITEKVEMLRQHADYGKRMAELGMKFLESEHGGIEKSADAIRAVVEGTTMEQDKRGMADAYLKVAHMTDSDLDRELERLLKGKENMILEDNSAAASDDETEETDLPG